MDLDGRARRAHELFNRMVYNDDGSRVLNWDDLPDIAKNAWRVVITDAIQHSESVNVGKMYDYAARWVLHIVQEGVDLYRLHKNDNPDLVAGIKQKLEEIRRILGSESSNV